MLFLSITGQKYFPNKAGFKHFGKYGLWGAETLFSAGGKKTEMLFDRVRRVNHKIIFGGLAIVGSYQLGFKKPKALNQYG